MLDPQSMAFEIGFEDFDLDLLPSNARHIGSNEFRTAVDTYYQQEFSELGGVVSVDFAPDRILVTWKSDDAETDLYEQAIGFLQRGDLRSAVPPLRALVAVEPNNTDAHYNLGMAFSDLGEFDTAQLHLLKVIHREPENVNALVALGVALYRAGNPTAARRRLEQALDLDSGNGYAHRNLAAILGNTGEPNRAIEHLRHAHRLLPDDQAAAFGLAHALDEFGEEGDLSEADKLYTATIALNPHTEIAELARQARSRIAQKHLHTAGEVRLDAVMYCLGALERFAQLGPADVQAIGFEVAKLGQTGIDVNNAAITYTLRSLPGEYTGLHLMSMMYVAFKQTAPHVDIGFDLAQEYASALELYEVRSHQS